MLAARPPAGLMETPAPFATEAELVAACKAGRRDAFDALVARFYDRIHRLAWNLAGPTPAADLAQETFLAAVKSFPNFRGDSQVGTWLVSILRNQVGLHLRGRKKWRYASLEGEGERLPAPEADETGKGVQAVLDRARELPEDLRTTLILFHVDGLKYAEIAQVLQCPVGTVRSRLFEARERLRKLCEKT